MILFLLCSICPPTCLLLIDIVNDFPGRRAKAHPGCSLLRPLGRSACGETPSGEEGVVGLLPAVTPAKAGPLGQAPGEVNS